MCLAKVHLSTCLVKMLAALSAPKTFTREKYPDRIRSWTHKSAVARCLIFPEPRRRHMPTAAVESVCNVKSNVRPRSLASDKSPSDVEAPLVIPPSSASAEDKVTTLWVTLQCLRR